MRGWSWPLTDTGETERDGGYFGALPLLCFSSRCLGDLEGRHQVGHRIYGSGAQGRGPGWRYELRSREQVGSLWNCKSGGELEESVTPGSFFFFLILIYFWKSTAGEGPRVWRGQRIRSRFHADSSDPDAGFELQNLEIMTYRGFGQCLEGRT